jgi:hypothetical protein
VIIFTLLRLISSSRSYILHHLHASTFTYLVTFTLLHSIKPLLAPNARDAPNQNKLPNTPLAPTSKPYLYERRLHITTSKPTKPPPSTMCTQPVLTCPLCHHTSIRPPSLCPDAEVWGRACKPPHVEGVIEATCSDECRAKEAEVREWGRRKAERREKERRGRYHVDDEGGERWRGEVGGWKEI